MNFNKLTPEEERIIINKGTELPYTGEYLNNQQEGIYLCKRCEAPLYLSDDKFDSHCGWPSFDDEIHEAIKRTPDADGRRTEITCSHCGAHLGHVFLNEHLTPKNTRHCVNSLSMKFVPVSGNDRFEKAYFASGCFWGTEYYFEKAKGVLKTTVGYMGGHTDNPTYQQVCSGNTGHAETMEVLYDTRQTSYEEMVKLFFETHDFTQYNRQGPDVGTQYRSVIFYTSQQQEDTAIKYKKILEEKGYQVATRIEQGNIFWKAEDYHQQYYKKRHQAPYCHVYRSIF